MHPRSCPHHLHDNNHFKRLLSPWLEYFKQLFVSLFAVAARLAPRMTSLDMETTKAKLVAQTDSSGEDAQPVPPPTWSVPRGKALLLAAVVAAVVGATYLAMLSRGERAGLAGAGFSVVGFAQQPKCSSREGDYCSGVSKTICCAPLECSAPYHGGPQGEKYSCEHPRQVQTTRQSVQVKRDGKCIDEMIGCSGEGQCCSPLSCKYDGPDARSKTCAL